MVLIVKGVGYEIHADRAQVATAAAPGYYAVTLDGLFPNAPVKAVSAVVTYVPAGDAYFAYTLMRSGGAIVQWTYGRRGDGILMVIYQVGNVAQNIDVCWMVIIER